MYADYKKNISLSTYSFFSQKDRDKERKKYFLSSDNSKRSANYKGEFLNSKCFKYLELGKKKKKKEKIFQIMTETSHTRQY